MSRLLIITKKLIPAKALRAMLPAYHFFTSFLAALFYLFPSEHLIVIGVTGTTGKTSTVFFLAQILRAAGYQVGYTSTAMFSDGRKDWLNDKKMTMVGRFFTQKMIKRMADNGCQYALIETTSEGIKQFRHRFINYDALIFTGLYPEHIEAHGGFQKYKEAKGELFKHLSRGRIKYVDAGKRVVKNPSGLKKTELERMKKTSVINGNDETASYFLSFWAERKIVFRFNNREASAPFANEEIVAYSPAIPVKASIKFNIFDQEVSAPLLGIFNAKNLAASAAVAFSQGIGKEKIIAALAEIKPPPGRLETVISESPFSVIVDYAFEPGALSELYKTVSSLEKKRIIHVLGSCGGGRDKARRPKLGELAGRNADIVIITNEDPYDEDPREIMEDVKAGAIDFKKQGQDLFIIEDRAEAISQALKMALPGDLVLITGKGSEQAICVANGGMIPWDDREVAREILTRQQGGSE